MIKGIFIGALVFVGSASAQEDDSAGRARRLEELEGITRMQAGARKSPSFVGDTTHRHLGFYFRPDLGPGYMAVQWAVGGGSVTWSGPAGFFGLHIGGAIDENVILGIHLWDGVIQDPTLSGGGQSVRAVGASLTLVGIGPELTWYVMPANVYVSASVAPTRLTVNINGTQGASEVGVGGRLGIGKEWWVSSHWGVGLVGHASLSWNRDQPGPVPSTFKTWALGLAVSATYN